MGVGVHFVKSYFMYWLFVRLRVLSSLSRRLGEDVVWLFWTCNVLLVLFITLCHSRWLLPSNTTQRDVHIFHHLRSQVRTSSKLSSNRSPWFLRLINWMPPTSYSGASLLSISGHPALHSQSPLWSDTRLSLHDCPLNSLVPPLLLPWHLASGLPSAQTTPQPRSRSPQVLAWLPSSYSCSLTLSIFAPVSHLSLEHCGDLWTDSGHFTSTLHSIQRACMHNRCGGIRDRIFGQDVKCK